MDALRLADRIRSSLGIEADIACGLDRICIYCKTEAQADTVVRELLPIIRKVDPKAGLTESAAPDEDEPMHYRGLTVDWDTVLASAADWDRVWR